MFPEGYWILIAVSLVLCGIGFYRFVWFMSVGYGFAVAGLGIALFVMSLVRGQFGIPFTILCALLVIYGLRLGLYLFIREVKNVKYREKMKEVGGDAKVPVFVAIFMWIYCGVFYVFQASGPVFRMLNNSGVNAAMIIGTVISAIGIFIEALADKQKGEAKEKNPNMPAMHGLYKMCRCPNYFGEITFWTGLLISGIGAISGWQWVPAIIGYVEIFFVMVSGAKRVETRHIKHYGKIAEYNEYADKTPLLFPLIPIYHVTSEEKIAAEEAAKKAKAEAKAAKLKK